MTEHYIRREGDEDSSGPFDMDQIASLLETGKLDTSAFFYDVEKEDWVRISESEEMMDALYPKKKRLTLRSSGDMRPAEEDTDEAAESEADKAGAAENGDGAKKAASKQRKPPRLKKKEKKEPAKEEISVERMLAQAEGRPENDPTGKSPVEKQAQAALIGLQLATFFLLASALAMGYIRFEIIESGDLRRMFTDPFVVVALVDVVLSGFLILQVTEIYPLVRFRSAVVAGLVTLLFLSSGDTILALSNLGIAISLYFCTALIKTSRILLFSLPAFAGVAGYAYVLALPLLQSGAPQ